MSEQNTPTLSEKRRYKILYHNGTDKVREIRMKSYRYATGWIHETHYLNPPDPKNCVTKVSGFSKDNPQTWNLNTPNQ